MVDIFTLLLSHGILALAAWRLMLRDDLDRDLQPKGKEPAREAEALPRRTFLRKRGSRDDA